jgi:hypothetical protein
MVRLTEKAGPDCLRLSLGIFLTLYFVVITLFLRSSHDQTLARQRKFIIPVASAMLVLATAVSCANSVLIRLYSYACIDLALNCRLCSNPSSVCL